MRPLLLAALLLGAAPLAAQTASPPEARLRFTLSGTLDGGQPTSDWAFLRFLPDALPGWDRHDGSKFSSAPAQIAFVGRRDGERVRLGMNAGPDGTAFPLPRAFGVKMEFMASRGGAFTLSWDGALAPGWKALLVDRETGQKVKTWRETSYAFRSDGTDWTQRFVLRVRPAQAEAAGKTAGLASVGVPSPNPTTGPARLGLTLAEAGDLRVAVVDALGREVAVAHDGRLAPGTHGLALPTETLPPGVYFVRVSGETLSETRRLTVAR